jgi:hypothetical protein
VKDTLARAQDALALHQQATETLRAWLASHDKAALDHGIELLTKAARQIGEVESAFKQIDENAGKVPCLKCGRANAAANRACAGCGAQLPRNASLYDGASIQGQQEAEIGENLARLLDATNKVHVGRMDSEAYAEVLTWMESLLNEVEAGVVAVETVQPERFRGGVREEAVQAQQVVEDARTAFLAGLAEFRNGLGELARFLEDGDETHLVEGLRTVWSAYEVVFHIDKLGREVARQSTESDAGDSGDDSEAAVAPLSGGDEVEITRG